MSAVPKLAPSQLPGTPPFDLARIRSDFPILGITVNGKPLAYLDNAASAQMPTPVIERIVRYQTHEHANIHRAVHYLSETATAEYEIARRKLQAFINAKEDREVVFVNLASFGDGIANAPAVKSLPNQPFGDGCSELIVSLSTAMS